MVVIITMYTCGALWLGITRGALCEWHCYAIHECYYPVECNSTVQDNNCIPSDKSSPNLDDGDAMRKLNETK